jgi:hypothetical protein
LAEKESTIERLELQEDTGTPGADHARRRAQTAVSATEHETHLALLFVHIDANIFQGWSPLSAASTALGIVER